MNTDMKKQTAVEWYENEINILIEKYENQEISKSDFIVMKHNLFYPAKAMEKEQIVDAYNSARNDHHQMYFAEEYYNETYGGDK
jgi:hypothetical protein